MNTRSDHLEEQHEEVAIGGVVVGADALRLHVIVGCGVLVSVRGAVGRQRCGERLVRDLGVGNSGLCERSRLARSTGRRRHSHALPGYLAQKKQPNPLGPPQDPRYERSTPGSPRTPNSKR